MYSASLHRNIPFIRGFSRSVSPRGMNKQQLEIIKKETKKEKQKNWTRVSSIRLPTALFKTTRETTSCLTTLIQNVTENHNIINFDDKWLLWLRNMVSKVTIA